MLAAGCHGGLSIQPAQNSVAPQIATRTQQEPVEMVLARMRSLIGICTRCPDRSGYDPQSRWAGGLSRNG
jgi:hypothetical protein